jgi:hypothetical protein
VPCFFRHAPDFCLDEVFGVELGFEKVDDVVIDPFLGDDDSFFSTDDEISSVVELTFPRFETFFFRKGV